MKYDDLQPLKISELKEGITIGLATQYPKSPYLVPEKKFFLCTNVNEFHQNEDYTAIRMQFIHSNESGFVVKECDKPPIVYEYINGCPEEEILRQHVIEKVMDVSELANKKGFCTGALTRRLINKRESCNDFAAKIPNGNFFRSPGHVVGFALLKLECDTPLWAECTGFDPQLHNTTQTVGYWYNDVIANLNALDDVEPLKNPAKVKAKEIYETLLTMVL